jgi:hypothetical protein
MRNFGHVFAAGRGALIAVSLLFAPLPSAVTYAQVQTPKDYQAQLDCTSPRNQELLDSRWHSDPRDNVWVLEVLNAMGLNRHCPELREDLIANYIERQAANDVVQEPIGEPATVREAIAWERKADEEKVPESVAHDREHIHRRLLTRGFAIEPWAPAAADIEQLRDRPKLAMSTPGLWIDATQPESSSTSVVLSLSFTNRATRPIEWDVHTLYARSVPDGQYDLMFACMRDGRIGPPFTVNLVTVAPDGRVNVVCAIANSGRPTGEFDAAWMQRLLHGEQQWFVDGPPSDGGTYDYKKTLARFASASSHTAAARYTSSLTCNQSSACRDAKVAWLQSPLYLWLRDGGTAALAAMGLVWLFSFGQRVRMARVATRLAVIFVLLFAGIFALIFTNGGSLGMGGVGLSLLAWRAGVGAVVGALLLRAWARRASGGA